MVEMDALEDILWILTVCCINISKQIFIMLNTNLNIWKKDKTGLLLQQQLGLPMHNLMVHKHGLLVDKNGLMVTYQLIRFDIS